METDLIQLSDETLAAARNISERLKSIVDKATEMYNALRPGANSSPCLKAGSLEDDPELFDLCLFAALNQKTESSSIHRGYNYAFTTDGEFDKLVGSSLYKMLSEKIKDPRNIQGRTYHYFADLLIVCVYAAFSGITTANGIATYCKANFMFFKSITIDLPKPPSHDTFNRVLRKVDNDQLAACLTDWTVENCEPPRIVKWNGKTHRMFDGKATRGAAESSNGEAPRYLLNSAIYGDSQQLYVLDIAGKGNEQSRTPEFISRFIEPHSIITGDAALAVNSTIRLIVDNEMDYLLPLKKNQGKLFDQVWNHVLALEGTAKSASNSTCEDGTQINAGIDKLPHCEVKKNGHGRREVWKCYVMSGPDLDFLKKWIGKINDKSFYDTIKSVAIIYKETRLTGKANIGKEPSQGKNFYFSTVENIKPEDVIELRSQHWAIEMNHYKVDRYLDEDQQTGRRENFMANCAILRRFVLLVKERTAETRFLTTQEFITYNRNILNIAKLLKML